MREKRRYIKRNCSYWGHDYKVIGRIKLDGTGVRLLQCKRCDVRTWSTGVTDTELKDLISTTLKNIPRPIPLIESPEYKYFRFLEPEPIKRRWWNLWDFWRLK